MMFEISIGALLVILVLFDVFQGIIVPRMASKTFRLAPFLLGKIYWPAYSKLAKIPFIERSGSEFLDIFAPMCFVSLMGVWLSLLILGYALILFGMRAEITPPIGNFGEAFYFAGTSVLTLGFGDIAAHGAVSRCVVLAAAVTGLVFMALQVSLLFTLQSMSQAREQVVNTIISRAGAPASGIVLLLRYKELKIVPSLSASFLAWESWIAGILESHRSYPMLLYFRSTNKSDSWMSVLGAMLDAATLLLTSIEEVAIGEAELFYWLSCSTVKTMCRYLGLNAVDGAHLTRSEFDDGLSLLRDAGYKTVEEDHAWKLFRMRRSGYAGYLAALAQFLCAPESAWIHELAIYQLSEKQAVSDSIFQPRV